MIILKYRVFGKDRTMAKKKHDVLISDHGVTTTNKVLHEKIFVFICRALSVVLAILGILAFAYGNFNI